ncbi:MAG: hypothetical protein ACR2NR_02075 [Solirubrobacteraceae bacterium]
MNRDVAVALLDRLHTAQNEFYAGGSGTGLQQLLAADIQWTVPGSNRIAGTYRGLKQVLAYFRRRRDLAERLYDLVDQRITACWLLPLDQPAFDAIWAA